MTIEQHVKNDKEHSCGKYLFACVRVDVVNKAHQCISFSEFYLRIFFCLINIFGRLQKIT